MDVLMKRRKEGRKKGMFKQEEGTRKKKRRIKEIGIFALRDLLVVPVPPCWLFKVVSSPPPLLFLTCNSPFFLPLAPLA